AAVRPGLPALRTMTPDATAACAVSTFVPNVQVPRWISAVRPSTNPLKSARVQPLDALGVGVGGMTIPPAGWRSALAVPVLCPDFHSELRAKTCAVGESSERLGGSWYA